MAFFAAGPFGAIVSGVWILHASYIQACMNANKILTNFSYFELVCSPPQL